MSATEADARARGAASDRRSRFLRSVLSPATYAHGLRLLNYYSYTHVMERRRVDMGREVRFSPNVVLANGHNIRIGQRSHIGARCTLWAGEETGTIDIGDYALFGPEVFVTATNYRHRLGPRVMEQPKTEAAVVIGPNTWLGARVMVLPGVEIGEGAVIGAGSVVTRSLPAWTVAVGSPARVVDERRIGDDRPT